MNVFSLLLVAGQSKIIQDLSLLQSQSNIDIHEAEKNSRKIIQTLSDLLAELNEEKNTYNIEGGIFDNSISEVKKLILHQHLFSLYISFLSQDYSTTINKLNSLIRSNLSGLNDSIKDSLLFIVLLSFISGEFRSVTIDQYDSIIKADLKKYKKLYSNLIQYSNVTFDTEKLADYSNFLSELLNASDFLREHYETVIYSFNISKSIFLQKIDLYKILKMQTTIIDKIICDYFGDSYGEFINSLRNKSSAAIIPTIYLELQKLHLIFNKKLLDFGDDFLNTFDNYSQKWNDFFKLFQEKSNRFYRIIEYTNNYYGTKGKNHLMKLVNTHLQSEEFVGVDLYLRLFSELRQSQKISSVDTINSIIERFTKNANRSNQFRVSNKIDIENSVRSMSNEFLFLLTSSDSNLSFQLCISFKEAPFSPVVSITINFLYKLDFREIEEFLEGPLIKVRSFQEFKNTDYFVKNKEVIEILIKIIKESF